MPSPTLSKAGVEAALAASFGNPPTPVRQMLTNQPFATEIIEAAITAYLAVALAWPGKREQRLLERIAAAVTTMQRETTTDLELGEAIAKECIPLFEALGLTNEGDGWGFATETLERLYAAPSYAGEGVVVRELEWEPLSRPNAERATPAIGVQYECMDFSPAWDNPVQLTIHEFKQENTKVLFFLTMEEGRAAAQADYASRIRSALAPAIASPRETELSDALASIMRSTSHAGQALRDIMDTANGRDRLDGFPRDKQERQRRLAKIYEIAHETYQAVFATGKSALASPPPDGGAV